MEDYTKSLLSDTKKLFSTGGLKTIIDNEPIGVAVFKPIKNNEDLLHVYINPAYQELIPKTPILGRPVTEVWPELADKIDRLFDQVLENGDRVQVKDVQVAMGKTDGKSTEIGYLSFTLSPISIDGEDRVVATVIDTTNEVRSRKPLISDEERYRIALNNSPVVAASVNKDLRYNWIINPHPAFDPASVIGKRDDELAPAEWVAELVKYKESVLNTAKGDRRIIPIIVQGKTRYYDITVEPLFDRQGKVSDMITSSIDVTDLKQSQDSLKQQAEKLAALHEIATVATSSLDLLDVSYKVLKNLAKVLGLSTATIFVVDEAHDVLVATALWGYPPEFFKSIAKIKIDSEYQTAQTFRSGQPIFFKDMDEAPEATRIAADKIEEITGKKVKSNSTLPLKAYGRPVGVVALTWPSQRKFAKEDFDFLNSIVHEIATGLENARLFEKEQRASEALREKDIAIRQAYTDVIDAVTGGKLILMTPEEIKSTLGQPVMDEKYVRQAEELMVARQAVRDILASQFEIKAVDKFIDPFGEALTNAVKHAGGGSYQVYRKADTVQIKISDKGPGIDFGNLPKATLKVGYSTSGTLGRGFNVMLNSADRVLLSTQPGSTTVVLETSL